MVGKSGKQLIWCLLATVVFTNLVWLGGCASIESQHNPAGMAAPGENAIRVGVSTNAPPLIFKREGKIVGLEADFAKAFADYLGKPLRFVEMKWEDQIPALLNNRTDIIMSGMSITELRQVRIAFSNPYFRNGQMALIRNQDQDRFKQGYYAIAKSKKIGTVKGTTGDFFVQKNFEEPKKLAFSTSKQGVAALKQRRIDVFIHDAPIILQLASENEASGLTPINTLLTEEYLAWGIRRGDAELLDSANAFIETLKTDDRLMQMVKRWIPLAR
jgi:polar amino acid transport system substrate-binding protein